ncbi:hypothetical protein NUW58_g7582 [Xylaria curta]|uniref:Uncharacterized protein n=1 Tax=Xylaria curta TaxID=42375 RepID=A0ACC1NFQ0_9PEZI|nr:hypothetical protein NUW58_g7582 [Xylaria curta]
MALDAHSNANPQGILGAGPYILRTLFADVPLSEDGSRDDITINCVEYLDRNLYIGTSDSELLHFFQIPPDPADHSDVPTFILASRLRPAFSEPAGASHVSWPGVQEILLLPGVGKACVLCNSTVTFYSLPELSPVFGTLQVKNCGWIGGVDLDRGAQDPDGATILLSLSRKIQLVRIGEDARVSKKIDFAGSRLSVRRDAIVCVADSRSYALLEIDRQLKIPLMSISSLDETQPGTVVGQAQDISGSAGGGLLRSNSSTQARTSLRTPRLLRTTPAAWSAQSRYYSDSKKPSQPDPTPKDGTPTHDSSDKPQAQSTRSPGPTDGEAHDDRLPLPEGWVHLTEKQIQLIQDLAASGPIRLPEKDRQALQKLRQTGVPRALLEISEKKEAGETLGITDFAKALKSMNTLAWCLAEIEARENNGKTQSSQPSQSYQASSSESSGQKPGDGKDQKKELPRNDESEPKRSQSGKNSFKSNRPPNPNNGNNPLKGNDWLTTVIATGVAYYLYSSMLGDTGREITWQELRKNFLDKGLVEKMVVVGHKVVVELNREATQSMYPDSAATRPGFNYYFSIASVDAFERRLEDAQNELGIPSSDRIPVSYAGESNMLNLVMAFGPTILLVGLLVYASRRGPGAGGSSGIFGFGKSKAKRFSHETAIKVKFSDVAGMDEAKQEIMEFVSFLKKPERFQRLGAKIPRGAILAGPPGTGKTLLAKATAGESGVPFFSVSGSEFVEMFVGVGASRVRDLFATARKNAPCIIFIDEIDAIGRARAEGQRFGGNDEREATLNQILTEMDGFNTSEQIVVLAGTNRVDILDKALMRPGRFDRHINIDAPTMAGRQDIFKVYLKKIVTNEDIEYLSGRLASLTPGFAGADIANCVNEAALIAARTNAPAVNLQHFEQAIERVIGGLERKSLVLDPVEKRTVAYHEAGHAICGWYFRYADPLLKVSIIPRGKGLGYAQYLPGDVYLMSYNQLMDRMAMTLGGRISEELHFPTVTTGASDDFSKVTKIATSMVTQWGMSEKVGPLHFSNDESKIHKPFSETTGQTIDAEVKRIVEAAYKQCKDLLIEKKKEVGIIAEELLRKEVLVRDDMVRLLGPRPFDDRDDFSKYFGAEAKTPPTDPTDPTEPPSSPHLPDAPEPPSPSPAAFQQLKDKDIRRTQGITRNFLALARPGSGGQVTSKLARALHTVL